MSKLSLKLFFVLLAFVWMFSVAAAAQDAPPEGRQFAEPERPNLLKELGLTREQVQEIRRMNQARRPLMEEAGRRLREANRALDAAIYADDLDEASVAARLREFQMAQAEIAKLRFQGELALRKILSPEQLSKFRALRERFGRAREMRQNMRRNAPPGERPLQRLRQLPRRGGRP